MEVLLLATHFLLQSDGAKYNVAMDAIALLTWPTAISWNLALYNLSNRRVPGASKGNYHVLKILYI